MLKKLWMAIGFILYLAIAMLLPVTVPLLGIFSDVPESWIRLIVPFLLIPFLMGFLQPYFLMPWRLQLWSPAILMLALSVFAFIDSFRHQKFMTQDLIFWPAMVLTYLLFSWLGVVMKRRLSVAQA